MEHHLLLLIVLVATAGLFAQWIASLLSLPAIVVLVATGFLIGPVLGLLEPEAQFGELLQPAISAAVSVIVLEGALSLDFAELRSARRGVLRLVLVGVPLVWALGAVVAHYVAGLQWALAVLIGAMLVITGPTVIQPLLRQAKLRRRTAALLKWEGVLNDAIGAVLTALVLEATVLLVHSDDINRTALQTMFSMMKGTVAGVALGIGSAWLLRAGFLRSWVPEFLKAPLTLTVGLLIYGVSDLVQPESGLIAVAVLGVAIANMHLPEIEEIKRFMENNTILLVSGVFIVLTATLETDSFFGLGLGSYVFILLTILVVRPVAIGLATQGAGMERRERAFVALIAPRGIVVAALATLSSTVLMRYEVEGAERILPIVFAVIIGTVVLHGFFMRPLAQALGLSPETRPGLIIVGSNRWTVTLGHLLEQLGTPIMISDARDEALRLADRQSLATHRGHILAPTTGAPEELKDFEYLLTATESDAFNALACLRFSSELGQQYVHMLPFQRLANRQLELHREWRGRIILPPEFTLQELERRMNDGWGFAVEELDGDGEIEDVMTADSKSRVPLLLIRPGGDLHFLNGEGDPPLLWAGHLVVFRADAANGLPLDPEEEAQAHRPAEPLPA